ncbi:hypothetical protein [Bordetella sp. LUAb4]|uniref:hypothetical protein n=1 Tax=Bordetella sp. LUAb4 TaxID=2843195 RepID=UPI001E59BD0D|nr:hypothetical protein [Bordetella sp. LUAb4]
MPMDLPTIQSVHELEQIGTVDEIRQRLELAVHPLRIDATTYPELLAVLQTLQTKWLDFHQGPFVSRQAELIFYLTELEGSVRNRLLGITDAHYQDKEVAKKWCRSLAQQVHSDKGGNDAAYRVLLDLYKVMTDSEDGDDDA